jgi:hypothetical protein
MKSLAPLRYPRFFQGIFARQREVYTPLVEEARRVLNALPQPEKLRPFYDTVVRDNPQPSFLLLPLMFLATAEASGGIKPTHQAYLPFMMLSMEAIAISDDTIDRTPMRSGRPSFPIHFSEASATPFVSTLVALVARESARIDPRLLDGAMNSIIDLFSCQLWERDHAYPTENQYEQWLDNRYLQSVLGASIGLDTALMLNDRPAMPLSVLEPFGRIFQDVDDIVNIVENRWTEGENDDLLMGAVTKPLLIALDKYPALRADVSALWEVCRATACATVSEVYREPAHSHAILAKLASPVRQAIVEVGVRGTTAQVLSDYRACVAATPPEFRPVIQELTFTWVDRLRRCKGADLLTEEQIRRALEGISREAA